MNHATVLRCGRQHRQLVERARQRAMRRANSRERWVGVLPMRLVPSGWEPKDAVRAFSLSGGTQVLGWEFMTYEDSVSILFTGPKPAPLLKGARVISFAEHSTGASL